MSAPKAKSALSARAKPRTREFGLVKGGKADPPKCPALLGEVKPLPSTVVAWNRLWTSDVADVVDLKSDLETVVRWATLLDERERAFRAYRVMRMVPGASGQAVLSPMWAVVRTCDTELRSLEDRIGLSPKARLMLGITFAEAGKSLDQLNRLMEANGDDDNAASAADPRLEAIEATAT